MSADDRYTYPGSGGVLRNRLGITDADQLDDVVNDFVSLNWADLLAEFAAADATWRFDLPGLREVHRCLFGDVFDWAGELREVEVQAAGTDGGIYCPRVEVAARLAAAFDGLVDAGELRDLDAIGFAAGLARFWTGLTTAHPFRDGNTRSQVFFIARLAEAAGHPIAWERVDHDSLRAQRLAAATGHPEALAFFIENHLVEPLW